MKTLTLTRPWRGWGRFQAWGLILLASLTSWAGAQTPPVGPEIKVRFRVYGWTDTVEDLNYEQKGKNSSKMEDIPIRVLPDIRSPFYEYKGPAKISFYRVKTGEDGKPIKEVAAEADLEKAGPWPLLIFFKDPAQPTGYALDVLPDDLQSFPAGTFEFANYSPNVITGSLSAEKFRLGTKQIKLIKAPASTQPAVAFVQLFKEDPDGKKPLYSNNWALQPMLRTIVFVRPSDETPTGLVARRIVESTEFPPENPNKKP